MPQAHRALVVGLDGATFDVLVPLAEAGVLPNIRALLRSASLAQLNSTRPFITPAAWSTFLTGADPASHGIVDFRYLDHRCGELKLNHAARLPVPTLLDAVSASGGSVVSLNLPMTYGAEVGKVPRNLIVGGLESPSIGAALADAPRFAAALAKRGIRYDLNPVWRKRPETYDELAACVRSTRAVFAGRAAAAELADSMYDWQLMIVQFQVLDALQHRAWHLLGLSRDGERVASPTWIHLTRLAFAALDAAVGRLCELAARRGAAVLVVSDHGFGPFRQKIRVPQLLADRGLLVRRQGWAGAGYRLRRWQWKARRWWWRRGHRGQSAAPFRRPLEALAAIDFRRSTTLAAHGDLAGMVYLNSRERFGRGPLATPRQCDQAAADTLAAFTEARHPETYEPLFEEAFVTSDRFGIDPVERMLPDVVAIPADGFHTRHKYDVGSELVCDDPTLSGTHRQEGVLLFDAPGTTIGDAVGDRYHAELAEVAPAILNLLGIEPPPTMNTNALASVWGHAQPRRAIKRAAAVTNSPQAASLKRTRIDRAHVAQGPHWSSDDDGDVDRRLRDLGYLD